MFQLLNKLESRISGAMLVFTAAVLWSTCCAFTKQCQMDPLLLTALRSTIGAIVLSPFLKWKQIVWDRYLLGATLSFTLLVITIITAMNYTNGSYALAMQYTASFWLFLYALLRNKGKFLWQKLVPILFLMAGTAVIVLQGLTPDDMIGIFFGLLSGIAFAGVSLFMSKAQVGSPIGLVSFVNIFAAIIAFILVFALQIEFVVPQESWASLLYLGTIQMPGGYLCYSLGIRKTSPEKASLISVWEFILTPVWTFFLLHELPSLLGFLGWALILLAVLLEAILMARYNAKTSL